MTTRSFAIAAAMVVAVLSGCGSGGSSDQSTAIANQIGGGASCYESQYEITNRIDNSKTPIYVCTAAAAKPICVTYENGIASDVTAEVRLLFANTLGSSKPSCIT
jgi:hypothetical protein